MESWTEKREREDERLTWFRAGWSAAANYNALTYRPKSPPTGMYDYTVGMERERDRQLKALAKDLK